MNWTDVAGNGGNSGTDNLLKSINEREDGRKAVEIGCTGVGHFQNHGGRQLDGSRSSFDQLRKIVDESGRMK